MLVVEKFSQAWAKVRWIVTLGACVQNGSVAGLTMAGEQGHTNITHRLDVLGFFCPVPVAKTREALEHLNTGNVLEVLADDPETLHDMPLLIGRGPHQLMNVQEHEGEIRFLIEVKA
ncbi:MAG TPA: hypothetical protein D7H91_00555 [Candidatus Poseidoniales archaeon]|nr:MAG TPA: hypothetical protein D7H91_00555 [Candidatus Poseidoniales archaeon]|tara:strand:+ start:551 stop:901 length:351 start_codon:yes stop_codon:yes gene_type:complete